MLVSRAPGDRQINSFRKPFDHRITPYGFTDFRDHVKNFCKKSRKQHCLRIGKIIFLGDIGVGKTSLINRYSIHITSFDHVIGQKCLRIAKFNVIFKPKLGVTNSNIYLWLLFIYLVIWSQWNTNIYKYFDVLQPQQGALYYTIVISIIAIAISV